MTLARARDPRWLRICAARRLRMPAPTTGVPPPRMVHRCCLQLSQVGLFKPIAHAATMADRERFGHEASPTACVGDVQATRSRGVGVAGQRGYEPA